MTTIVTVLTDGFADWETALLNAAARSYYGIETLFAAPGGQPVVSSGGLNVTPQLTLEDIDFDALDALVVCGGTIWQQADAPDLTPLLRAAQTRGKVVGVICDATLAAAKAGLLDSVAHTSNGAGHLDATGYKGKSLYRDVPHAVSDQRIVTAPGTAPVSFMAEIMGALGLADDNLAFYLGLYAAEHRPAAKAA